MASLSKNVWSHCLNLPAALSVETDAFLIISVTAFQAPKKNSLDILDPGPHNHHPPHHIFLQDMHIMGLENSYGQTNATLKCCCAAQTFSKNKP